MWPNYLNLFFVVFSLYFAMNGQGQTARPTNTANRYFRHQLVRSLTFFAFGRVPAVLTYNPNDALDGRRIQLLQLFNSQLGLHRFSEVRIMKCSASTNEYNQHDLNPKGKPGKWIRCTREATTVVPRQVPEQPVCSFHAKHFAAVAQRNIDAIKRK